MSGHPRAGYFLNNAVDLFKLGQVELALEQLRIGTQVDGEGQLIWWELANFLKHLGRYDEAEKAYVQAIERDRNQGDIWFTLGDMYMRCMNRPEDGLKCCREAIRCNPNDEQSYCLVAEALQRLGKMSDALTSLDDAIRSNASFSEAKAMRNRIAANFQNYLRNIAKSGPFGTTDR